MRRTTTQQKYLKFDIRKMASRPLLYTHFLQLTFY